MATVYKTKSLSLSSPRGVAVDTELGYVLICDSGNNKLVRTYISGFKFKDETSSYDSNDFNTPSDVCYHKGYYYVCATTNHTLVRFRARDMEYKDHFGTDGTSGSSTSLLSSPQAVCTDGQYLYICDTGNSRIVKLTLSTLAYDSQTSSINGSLTAPSGICYRREGNEKYLYISDTSNDRVIKCTTDFVYLEENSTSFSGPFHLIVYKDFVHVCDNSDEIVVLASNGLAEITALTDTTIELTDPFGIAVYEDVILITDTDNGITAWRAYNPRDAFTSATTIKFGGKFFDNPLIIIDDDTVIVGDTQEYGSPNRWKEENSNMRMLGWTAETDLSDPSWSS